MLRTRALKLTFFVTIAVFVALGTVATWRDTVTKNAITQVVNQGIHNGFQALYQVAPRVKMTDQNSTYYVPDMQHLNGQTFPVYKETLETVNSDLAAPICKVAAFDVFGTGNMQVSATVMYRGFLGVVHTIHIQKEVDSPHFKNPTGSEHY